LSGRNYTTQFLYENFQRYSCKAFTGLSNRAKMVSGACLIYVKIWLKLTHPLQSADFQSMFDRGASAVTLSEKVQLTRIASPLQAFQ